MSLASINRRPFDEIVPADLSLYRGLWVAIRDARIVASAVDATELRANPEVRPDDLFLLVPAEAIGTYIL